MNVSSMVIKTAPDSMSNVMESLKDAGLCDIHFHDLGRIIVTIEGESIGEEMQRMKAIQNMPGVLSAELAYSYSEHEIQKAMEQLKTAGAVPEILHRDAADANETGGGS